MMCADASLDNWLLPSNHVHPIILLIFFIRWSSFTLYSHTLQCSHRLHTIHRYQVVPYLLARTSTLKRLVIPYKQFLVPGSDYYASTTLLPVPCGLKILTV